MPNQEVTNILLVGVGGQGTILASKVLSGAAQLAGMEVKVSEIHGMAQRGGSVVTQVRFGNKVSSPLIAPGEAHFIVAFEKLEALRWLHYLAPGGTVIINDQVIEPVPVLLGIQKYPANVLEQIRDKANTVVVDAHYKAAEIGNAKAANVLLVGVLAKYLKLPAQVWQETLSCKIPAKVFAVNEKAFATGLAL